MHTKVRPVSKVGLGLIYCAWFNHFYTLGSYYGIYRNMHWAMSELNVGPEYQTGRTI